MDIGTVWTPSFVLVCPMTADGEDWMLENLDYAPSAGGSIPVEHRYIADVVNGAREDGLVVERLD